MWVRDVALNAVCAQPLQDLLIPLHQATRDLNTGLPLACTKCQRKEVRTRKGQGDGRRAHAIELVCLRTHTRTQPSSTQPRAHKHDRHKHPLRTPGTMQCSACVRDRRRHKRRNEMMHNTNRPQLPANEMCGCEDERNAREKTKGSGSE